MALTIKDLIAKMEALAQPDAEVFFMTWDGESYPVGGGLLAFGLASPGHGLVLSERPIMGEAGF